MHFCEHVSHMPSSVTNRVITLPKPGSLAPLSKRLAVGTEELAGGISSDLRIPERPVEHVVYLAEPFKVGEYLPGGPGRKIDDNLAQFFCH